MGFLRGTSATVKRNKGRAGSRAVCEKAFEERTKNLSVVAAANVLDVPTNEEYKAFLLSQHHPGLCGKLGSVYTRLAAVEARSAQRREQQEREKQRVGDETSMSMITVELESTSTSADDTTEKGNKNGEARASGVLQENEYKHDHAKCSSVSRQYQDYRPGSSLCPAAAAHLLGHNVSEMNTNRSSIQRPRWKHQVDVCAASSRNYVVTERSSLTGIGNK